MLEDLEEDIGTFKLGDLLCGFVSGVKLTGTQ